MSNKKLFSDKRWTQPLGGVVIGYEEVTEEEKQMAEAAHKEVLRQREEYMKNHQND